MISKRVQYSGRVQGVGFRYKTHRIAQTYKVTGYVKNLPNGQVEVIVKGEELEINRFLSAVSQQMALNIENMMVVDLESSESQNFSDFLIEF